jgi:hypothetical protein
VVNSEGRGDEMKPANIKYATVIALSLMITFIGGRLTVAEEETGKRISSPEEATKLLSKEAQENARREAAELGVGYEDFTSVMKALGDLRKFKDAKGRSNEELQADLDEIEKMKDKRRQINEFVLTNEPDQVKKFMKSHYLLETLLVRGQQSKIDTAKLSRKEKDNLRLLLEMYGDFEIFSGLPYAVRANKLKESLTGGK